MLCHFPVQSVTFEATALIIQYIGRQCYTSPALYGTNLLQFAFLCSHCNCSYPILIHKSHSTLYCCLSSISLLGWMFFILIMTSLSVFSLIQSNMYSFFKFRTGTTVQICALGFLLLFSVHSSLLNPCHALLPALMHIYQCSPYLTPHLNSSLPGKILLNPHRSSSFWKGASLCHF